jgi:conjugative transfer region protein (TIGR03748 family)
MIGMMIFGNNKMKMVIVTLTLLLTMTINVIHHSAFAISGSTTLDRYLTSAASVNVPQPSVLSQIITLKLPANVHTIGDAMNYVLTFSGYQLVAADKQSKLLQNLLANRLSVTDRDFTAITVHDALSQLSAPAFTPVIDPVHRLVNFKLKKNYELLYTQGKSK